MKFMQHFSTGFGDKILNIITIVEIEVYIFESLLLLNSCLWAESFSVMWKLSALLRAGEKKYTHCYRKALSTVPSAEARAR